MRTPNWQHYTAVRQLFDPTAALQSRVYGSFGKPNIINFVKGELSPDLMPLELLQQWLPELNLTEPFSYYCSFKVDASLRKTISERLQAENGILTDTEHLLINAGVKALASSDRPHAPSNRDTIAVEGPTYLYSMNVLSSAGLRLVKLPIEREGLNTDHYPDKMILTNPTCQNPTGNTLSQQRSARAFFACPAGYSAPTMAFFSSRSIDRRGTNSGGGSPFGQGTVEDKIITTSKKPPFS